MATSHTQNTSTIPPMPQLTEEETRISQEAENIFRSHYTTGILSGTAAGFLTSYLMRTRTRGTPALMMIAGFTITGEIIGRITGRKAGNQYLLANLPRDSPLRGWLDKVMELQHQNARQHQHQQQHEQGYSRVGTNEHGFMSDNHTRTTMNDVNRDELHRRETEINTSSNDPTWTRSSASSAYHTQEEQRSPETQQSAWDKLRAVSKPQSSWERIRQSQATSSSSSSSSGQSTQQPLQQEDAAGGRFARSWEEMDPSANSGFARSREDMERNATRRTRRVNQWGDPVE